MEEEMENGTAVEENNDYNSYNDNYEQYQRA